MPASTSKEFRQCFGNGSQIFIQVACLLDEAEIKSRQFQGFYIGGIVLITAIYMIVFIDYMALVSKNDYVEWDLATITAGDFTIEFDIGADFYEKFIIKHGAKKPEDASMGQHFRDWIHKEMEDKLSKMPNLGYDDIPPQHIEIAATTFAFENGQLIKLLRKRGAAIMGDKFDTMRDLDKQINDLKNDQFEKLTRPVSVFMTFETEEGYRRAVSFDEEVEKLDVMRRDIKYWFNDPNMTVELQEASEPSDIIWENREYTPRQRRCKEVVVVIIISLCLLGAAFVILMGRIKQANYVKKYPKFPCQPFYDTYGSNLQHFAVAEYDYNLQLEAQGKPFQFVGYT